MRVPSVLSPRSFQLEAAVHSLILAHAQRAGIDRSEAVGFFQTLRTNALRAAMQAGGGGADEILRPDQLMFIAAVDVGGDAARARILLAAQPGTLIATDDLPCMQVLTTAPREWFMGTRHVEYP